LTGPVFLSRSAAGRATRLRPPRSFPSWRPSRPPTASRSSWWSLTSACSRRPTWRPWMRRGCVSSSRGPHHPRPGRPGGPLPLGRGRLHRRAGHRHHHSQAGLAERAGQEPRGRAGVGPGHSPGLVEGGGSTPRSVRPGTIRP